MKMKLQKLYISIIKKSLKNANDEKLKCEMEKEVTTTRIILANSSEISHENKFTQSNGCQDFMKAIDGLSKEIQQREAYIKRVEEKLFKYLLDRPDDVHDIRIFEPALTIPISYPECLENQVYRSGACRQLIKRTNVPLRFMPQSRTLTTRHPSLKTD